MHAFLRRFLVISGGGFWVIAVLTLALNASAQLALGWAIFLVLALAGAAIWHLVSAYKGQQTTQVALRSELEQLRSSPPQSSPLAQP